MSEEQLERSILERKASDELRAIATAMSLEPVARLRKADLVNQILRAAGVEVEGTSPLSATTAASVQSSPSNGGATVTSQAPEADGASTSKPARGRTSRARSTVKARPADSSPAHAEVNGSGGGQAHELSEGNGVSTPAGSAFLYGSDSADSTEVGDAVAEGAAAVLASSGLGRASREPAPNTGASLASGESRPGEITSNLAGGAASGTETLDRVSGEVSTTTRPQRQAPQHSQPGRGNQSSQGGQIGQIGQGGQVETGNRRGRRRRGRDRERGGQEPQGGGQEVAWQGELVPVRGLLDLRDEGYGFLRTSGYLPSGKDVYISVSQARRFALRRGDAIEGACRPAGPSEKYPALLRIDTVCGMTPEEARERPRFEDLTPLFPDQRMRLELKDDPLNTTARIVDLISPIGKGQRSMIVSPPKAGKTTILKQIAHSIEQNDPSVHLMVLLVDERPEEATDWRRSVKGEVIASTFDRPADEHTTVAELAIERAKRLVELGRDVVIILDGITRLARAYNLAQPATGRIMSGGVDSGALYPPKKFFGAARNIEEGGSLTILATALVETGSKMDEVIFEEFKGTGNMELRLDRKLAERRIYPAIDVNASSTRHEELLFDRSQLQQVWKLRRVLNALGGDGGGGAGLELLMDKIRTTRSNDEFLAEIAKAPIPGG
ncbi:MAG: transcription termination factor Rho [Acidimicrobiales bacterium]|jgi:transcription termination factor Rho